MIVDSVVDSAVDYAIYLLDLDGTVKSWNAGAQRIQGYSAQEIIGSNFSVFYTDDDVRAGAPVRALEIARTTGRFEAEGWRVRKDGTRLWASVVMDAVRNPADELVGFATITRDVTVSAALREVSSKDSASIAQMLVDSVVDYAIYLLDLDGTVKSWNAGAQRIQGYSVQEIIGSNFSVFYTDDDVRAGAPVRALEIARTTGRFETEGWRVRKDGTRLWASVVMDAVRNPADELVGFAKITRDVTERTEAAEQLVLSAERDRATSVKLGETNRLMQMAEQLAHIGYFHLDVPANELSWSDEIYRIQGLPKSHRPELANAIEVFHSDDRLFVRGCVERAIADGTVFSYEARVAHTDGGYRDVICNGQIERADSGKIIGVFGVAQDITQRKDAERERDRLAERVRLATQGSQVGIWDWDIAANATVWDATMFALYGIEGTQLALPYEKCLELIHQDDFERVVEALTKAVSGEESLDTEFRVVWPNGEVRNIRAMATVVRNGSGSAERMIGTNWDVTEVRMLAEELRQEKERLAEAKQAAEDASRAKSEFLASMSHEIRTPMNAIIGLTSLLDGDLTPEQQGHVTLIADAGRSLLAIINGILDLSKVEAGMIDLEAVALRPDALVDGAVSTVREMAAAKGIALDTHIAPDVPAWVSGDPTRLRQILLNLLSNALKFTDNGRVGVEVRRELQADSDLLRFEISDMGIGVAPDRQHLLFKSFSQVDRSIARKYGGTGLGLALSKRLSEAMSGTMGMTSTLGAGSVFWFTARLPAVVSPSRSSVLSKTVLSTARRILVVDDDATNQMVAKLMLVRDGHHVVLAADGAEAVAAVKASWFDLVLMDMQMPTMDGIEATRRIRALDGPVSNIPIVAMTASAMAEQIASCHDAGMNAHLSKPIDRELLRQAIATWGTAGDTIRGYCK